MIQLQSQGLHRQWLWTPQPPRAPGRRIGTLPAHLQGLAVARPPRHSGSTPGLMVSPPCPVSGHPRGKGVPPEMTAPLAKTSMGAQPPHPASGHGPGVSSVLPPRRVPWTPASPSGRPAICLSVGSPGGAVVKDPPANAGDVRDSGSIPGLGRSPGEGDSSPLQYSCLESPTRRGAWRAAVHGVREADTTAEI